jgi:hypothetical protein
MAGQANGNGTETIFTVPARETLDVTDLLVQNADGGDGTISFAQNGTVLIRWTMADFRDLDYHWISPIEFAPGQKLQIVVKDCAKNCDPGLYVAGNLVTS